MWRGPFYLNFIISTSIKKIIIISLRRTLWIDLILEYAKEISLCTQICAVQHQRSIKIPQYTTRANVSQNILIKHANPALRLRTHEVLLDRYKCNATIWIVGLFHQPRTTQPFSCRVHVSRFPCPHLPLRN